MYGVELHANAIQQILDNNHIQSKLSFFGFNSSIYDKVISLSLSLLLAFVILLFINYMRPLFSISLTLILIMTWFNIAIGAFLNDYLFLIKFILGTKTNIPGINESNMLPVIYPISSMILSYGFNLSYKLYTENLDKKFLKNTFGNYISSDLVDEMFKNKKIPELVKEDIIL